MKKVNQFVFDMEEYGIITNSVSTAKVNLETVMETMNTRTCSKEEVNEWLSSIVQKLRLAENILRG